MNFIESDETLKSLINEIPKPVIIFDVRTLKILSTNKAASKLFGFSDSDIIPFTLNDIIDYPDDSLFPESLSNKIENIKFKIKDNPEFFSDAKIINNCTGDSRLLILNKNSSDFRENFHINHTLIPPDILSNIIDAVIAFDLNNKLLFWNNAADKLFGISYEEALAKTPREIFNLNNKKSIDFNDLFNSMLKVKSRSDVSKIRLKNGKNIFIEMNISLMQNQNKETEGTIIVARDVTDKKIIEDELKKSKEELNIIISNVADGITLQNKEGLIFANDTAAHLCGFSTAEELLKTPVTDIFKKYELFDEFNNPFPVEKLPGRIALFEGKKSSKILRFRIKESGKEGWSIVHSAPILNENGEARSAINVFHDISELKQAEEKIKISEKRFRLMIDQSPLSKSIISTDGKILKVNKAWEKLFGASINDLQDYNIFEDEQLKKVRIMTLVRKVFQGETVKFPPLNYIPDRGGNKGKELWFRSYMYPVVDDDGLIKEIVLIHEDISEQKKARDQIEESLKEKEILLKEIHHRVKNNLQIISSLLNLQSNYTDDKNAIEIISESQQRVKSMALIHEKLYQNKGLSKINFQEYIEDLVANLFHSYYTCSKYVEPVLSVEPVYLNIDIAVSLGLIINELVSNSLKYAFTPMLNQKQEIRNKGILSINLHQENSSLMVSIYDNGVGFPKELNFRDTESLGLQLVNTLVEQHGGNIELETSEGTKFIAQIPLNTNI